MFRTVRCIRSALPFEFVTLGSGNQSVFQKGRRNLILFRNFAVIIDVVVNKVNQLSVIFTVNRRDRPFQAWTDDSTDPVDRRVGSTILLQQPVLYLLAFGTSHTIWSFSLMPELGWLPTLQSCRTIDGHNVYANCSACLHERRRTSILDHRQHCVQKRHLSKTPLSSLRTTSTTLQTRLQPSLSHVCSPDIACHCRIVNARFSFLGRHTTTSFF